MMKKLLIISSLIVICNYILFNFFEFYQIIGVPESSPAKCIDGSNYQFYFKKGFGNSINNYILFFDGGGWCSKKYYNSTIESCYKRSYTYLGSSNVGIFKKIVNFIGFYPIFTLWGPYLSSNFNVNPTFHNWNKVFISYCDGRGFVGHNNDPIIFKNKSLYFRGYDNYLSVMDFLKINSNMNNTGQIIVSGVSAGGTASLIYSNHIKEMFPNAEVRTISDSGFFLDYANIDNSKYNFSVIWKDILVETKPEIGPLISSYCFEEEKWKCFVPEYFISSINVPIFLIHSQYDIYELCNLVGSQCDIGIFNGHINAPLELAESHRLKLLSVFNSLSDHKGLAIWSPRCYLHDYLFYSFSWDKTLINNISLAEALKKWINKGENQIDFIDLNENIKCHKYRDLTFYIEYFGILKDIF
jgi:hypothetical protein